MLKSERLGRSHKPSLSTNGLQTNTWCSEGHFFFLAQNRCSDVFKNYYIIIIFKKSLKIWRLFSMTQQNQGNNGRSASAGEERTTKVTT